MNLFSEGASPSNCVHILNGHFIENLESQFSKQKFDVFIENLSSFFHLISLEEAVSLIENKAIVTEPKLALTFDDGFLECYTTMLSVFEKYNVKASFFINPLSIENQENGFASYFIRKNLNICLDKKFMTWDMVKEIQSLGHVIGSHTTTHANLKGLTTFELQKEIIDSKKIIENITGHPCDFFAFPFGTREYFDQYAIDLVIKTYRYAFTSEFYSNYFFEGNKNILSRRHFECNWPLEHIKYFTSVNRFHNY